MLGREFDRDLLVALWPSDGPDLEPAMAQLAVQDVLRPVPGERARCEFSHALLQEAAYDRILRRRRQALHGRVAGVLTERFSTVVEREPEIVARHWDYAAEPEKAVGLLATRPGCARWSARPSWSPPSTSAAGWRRSTRPVSMSAGDLERVDLLTYRAASLQAAHGYAADGRPGGLRGGPPGVRAHGRRRAAGLRQPRRVELSICCARSTARPWPSGTRCWRWASSAGDEVRLAEGHLYRGLVHMYLANFEVARGHLEQAFARYHRSDRFVQIYEAQGDMGVGRAGLPRARSCGTWVSPTSRATARTSASSSPRRSAVR